jgi:hypothetical protein
VRTHLVVISPASAAWLGLRLRCPAAWGQHEVVSTPRVVGVMWSVVRDADPSWHGCGTSTMSTHTTQPEGELTKLPSADW